MSHSRSLPGCASFFRKNFNRKTPLARRFPYVSSEPVSRILSSFKPALRGRSESEGRPSLSARDCSRAQASYLICSCTGSAFAPGPIARPPREPLPHDFNLAALLAEASLFRDAAVCFCCVPCKPRGSHGTSRRCGTRTNVRRLRAASFPGLGESRSSLVTRDMMPSLVPGCR